MMDNKKPVSFIIPAYNCGDVITESVKSIINGNYDFGDDIIIVNDGSTDDTLSVISSIQEEYPYIQIINNEENIGCPATRNVGIRAANNPVIFNLDADDLLVSGSKKILLQKMLSEQADVVAFGEIHFFLTNSPRKTTHKWICKPGVMTLADYLAGHVVPGGNYIYTKASWERIGGYWEYGKGLHEYWGFSLKQIAMGSKFYVVPKTYYHHRYGRNSLYIRTNAEENASSLMATKMIQPFLHLLEEEDAQYIVSSVGSKEWFDRFDERPLRVKGLQIGVPGRIEHTITLTSRLEKLKSMIKKTIKQVFHPIFAAVKRISSRVEFWQEYRRFCSMQENNLRFQLNWKERYPILNEKTSTTQFDSHYTYHPAWAARILAQTRPSLHVDISSTLHFCTMVSAFIPVEFYDYRPAELSLSGLESKHGDLTHLPFSDNSVESLSCMHVVEHIGLGRYGDPLDPDGDLKAIVELKRVLKPGGSLLFVVPVGQPKILFNAHRIYSYEQIVSYFSDFQIEQFALVNDRGKFTVNATPDEAGQQRYGCGCWWFIKS